MRFFEMGKYPILKFQLFFSILARQSYQLFGKGVFQRQLRLAPTAKWYKAINNLN